MSNHLDYQALGERMRERRRMLKLTQEKLAERVGVSSSFIGHLERAEKIPSLATTVEICLALGVSMDHLVLGKRDTRCDQVDCLLYAEIKRVLNGFRS